MVALKNGNTYDAVILAGGRNTRLKGVIPSYHKPLMVVNGRPLIVTLVKHTIALCRHVVVVVSPQNASIICEVLADNDLLDDPNRVTVLIQPEAKGPGEAVLRALRSCRSKRVMVICGDNIIPQRDFIDALKVDRGATETYEHPERVVTASVTLTDDEDEALRFTRIGDSGFIEGVPGGRDDDGIFTCWVGPLIFDTRDGELIYTRAVATCKGGEVKVSGPLNDTNMLEIATSLGSSVDIGTSDSLLQLVGEV